MLISLNWVKSYLPELKISDRELIKLIGSRLVEVEGVDDQTHKYDGIYVVEVKECEKIEGTHLSRCLVDDGGRASDVVRNEDGFVQVMCGAPNVHLGMFAAWIAPGATVPASLHDAEPFVIGMRHMLKKYDSYGMMAGIDELDLGDDHSGIMELDPASVKAGMDFADALDLRDLILDIENKSLTHRPDTFGIIGFAREVAGILGLPFTAPEWTHRDASNIKNAAGLDVQIKIDDLQLCPRYSALVLDLEKHERSPYYTKESALLARAGMRSIDPIVDATNLLMLTTGQPTHAFDLDKFVAVGSGRDLAEVRAARELQAQVNVRAAREGEKLTLLDQSEVELCADDIVIASGEQAVALAGAMGGASTEIDADTKRVLLESASFSLYNLRKTQMNHGIFTEAITRFTKGQPSSQTMMVALATAAKMRDFAKLSAAFDSQEEADAPIVVSVMRSHINALLGADYSADLIKRTLENVEFKVELLEKGDDVEILATAPAWRTDIHIAEDICEEIGRLNGFDNIQPVLPLHATPQDNALFELKKKYRNALCSYGANEVLTYSFVHGDLLEKVGQDRKNSFRIVNSISPDLQYIRQAIVPSLLDKAYGNLRAGYANFALFEMNQVYLKDMGLFEDSVPANEHQLGFIYLDDKSQACYYNAKLYLEKLLARFNVNFELATFEPAGNQKNAYYEPLRSATIKDCDGEILGYLGEIRADILQAMKLPLGTAAFELNLEKLLKFVDAKKPRLQISAYPAVSRDVTLAVELDAAYAPIERTLRQVLEGRGLYYKLNCTSIYHAEGAKQKNISFHIEFSDPSKTLTKADIQDIMKALENIK